MKSKTATVERDLHTSRPFWAATPNITVKAATNASRRDYDVIVVGAGISGALAAQALADGRRRVLVAEGARPVRGSTLASTAMIQHEIDVPLHRLARMIGEEKAVRAWRRSARAVEELQNLVSDLGIDCSMEAKKALYIAGDDVGSRALGTEAAMRVSGGLEAEYLKAGDLRDRFGIERTAAIVSDVSASANPAQMTAGLLKAAAAKGVEIVAPLEITDFEETDGGVCLASADGRLLLAESVVFCSGYQFLERMRSRSHKIILTWAIATEPHAKRPGWLDHFLAWEGSDPYLYFRATPDGRIIAGGEDEDDPLAHEDRTKGARKYATIASKLGDLLGIDIGAPAYGWAAPFGTTTTGLPIIDTVPGTKRVHAVMGFGGNGITFSMIAAQIVAARVAGRKDPDEDLFRYPGD